MIVEAVLAGQSHGAVARQYGVSKVWVGKLVARGVPVGDALATQSTRPRSNPNATNQDVVNQPLGRPPGPPQRSPQTAAASPRNIRSPETPVNDVSGLHNGAASGI